MPVNILKLKTTDQMDDLSLPVVATDVIEVRRNGKTYKTPLTGLENVSSELPPEVAAEINPLIAFYNWSRLYYTNADDTSVLDVTNGAYQYVTVTHTNAYDLQVTNMDADYNSIVIEITLPASNGIEFTTINPKYWLEPEGTSESVINDLKTGGTFKLLIERVTNADTSTGYSLTVLGKLGA